jgi:carbamoyl-phosphate synthase/aspartate carbamoyltransferase/dihydroorotase
MRPPLGTREDQQALWDNLDVIDMLATDHAPHTLSEKRSGTPPPGVPGLETALPLMLSAVGEGRLTMEKLADMMHGAPARTFGLKPPPETHVMAETSVRAEIRGSEMQMLCKWTPFEGMAVTARVVETRVRGARAWADGKVHVSSGFGQNVI